MAAAPRDDLQQAQTIVFVHGAAYASNIERLNLQIIVEALTRCVPLCRSAP